VYQKHGLVFCCPVVPSVSTPRFVGFGEEREKALRTPNQTFHGGGGAFGARGGGGGEQASPHRVTPPIGPRGGGPPGGLQTSRLRRRNNLIFLKGPSHGGLLKKTTGRGEIPGGRVGGGRNPRGPPNPTPRAPMGPGQPCCEPHKGGGRSSRWEKKTKRVPLGFA